MITMTYSGSQQNISWVERHKSQVVLCVVQLWGNFKAEFSSDEYNVFCLMFNGNEKI